MVLSECAHLFMFAVFVLTVEECSGNDDAKRLYHDLLIQNKYNKLIRPIGNNTDRPLTVKMGIRLSQIIDVVSTCTLYFVMIVASGFMRAYHNLSNINDAPDTISRQHQSPSLNALKYLILNTP